MIRILFAAALLVMSCQAAAAGLPPKVEIKYKISMGSVKIGEGTDVFEHDGKTYKVVSESTTAGLAALISFDLRRESTGTVTAKGLRPDDYRETRNGQLKRSVHFDWQKKQADLQDGDRKQTVPLPDNTWDNTSFGYNFAFGKPEAGDMDLYLTDGRRVQSYRYTVVGKEKLDTALGPMDTVHVRKVLEGDDKRGFDVWVATEHHLLPVRILYTEKNGTTFDSVVTQITPSR
jgi:Protein of unknown function (DUF3108)